MQPVANVRYRTVGYGAAGRR